MTSVFIKRQKSGHRRTRGVRSASHGMADAGVQELEEGHTEGHWSLGQKLDRQEGASLKASRGNKARQHLDL